MPGQTVEFCELLLWRVHDLLSEVVAVVVRQVVRLSKLVVAPVSPQVVLEELKSLRVDLVALELLDGRLKQSSQLVVVAHRAEDDRPARVHDLASETGELGVVDLLGHVVSEEIGEETGAGGVEG